MRFPRAIFLTLLTVASLAMGNAGLRVLHASGGCDAATPATASAEAHCDHHCHHDGDASPAGGHGDEAPADDGTAPDECATCELLLALAGLGGQAVPAPTFHALVAVNDDDAPARLPAPAPIRALAARPPPAC
jgi:hypothetical protein